MTLLPLALLRATMYIMYSSHVITVIGLCPPASAPCCNVGTRSTSVPSMLIDFFLSLHTSKSRRHTRAHTQGEMDGWMDGTCKPPKKGGKRQ